MKPGLRPAVFLDRDGVINRTVVRAGKPYPPDTVEEFSILDGVAEACGLLKQAGYLLVVVTNQPDVGRGTQTIELVNEMHRVMNRTIPVDHVEMCCEPHDMPESNRRKPKPGMLLDAARALNIDLQGSFMVGDRWRDVDCGHAAGCTTIFIDYGYDEPLRAKPDLIAVSLLDAAQKILHRTSAFQEKTEGEKENQCQTA